MRSLQRKGSSYLPEFRESIAIQEAPNKPPEYFSSKSRTGLEAYQNMSDDLSDYLSALIKRRRLLFDN